MAILAVIFGLVAAVGWGFGDFLGAKTSKRFGGLTASAVLQFLSAILFGIAYLLFFRQHTVFDATGWMYASLSAITFTSANLMFYKGLEYGPVSIVSPIGSLYPLVTTLMLVLLFGAVLSVRQGLGIAIVMGGMLAASGLFERVTNGKRLSKGPFLGVGAGLMWGVSWVLIAQAVGHIGWQLTALIELTCSALLFLPLLPLLARQEPKLLRRIVPSLKSRLAISAAALTSFGFLALSMGLEIVGDYAVIAIVISSCYAVLTALLALRHLNEAFEPIPVIGAFVAIAGIVILSLG